MIFNHKQVLRKKLFISLNGKTSQRTTNPACMFNVSYQALLRGVWLQRRQIHDRIDACNLSYRHSVHSVFLYLRSKQT